VYHYYKNKKKYPVELQAQTQRALAAVEKEMGKKFGDPTNPLLVSVRSGARKSMPGMMETVLDIGLNEKTIEGVIQQSATHVLHMMPIVV
jgi:pyruvate,orthophosphate dikinase